MGFNSVLDASISNNEEPNQKQIPLFEKKHTVVFVLGGPGGGKSTQCSNIAKHIGYTHLSSGELLRNASKLDPENRELIESFIKEGRSVPTDITMRVLKRAMEDSGNDKFLLDGFPRDEEIRSAFEEATKIEPELVLFFDCSPEERERRILGRKQGRVDDNAKSVRKRFNYFEEHTLPVVEYYRCKGKVTVIDASKPEEVVFEKLKSCLSSLSPQEVEEEEARGEVVAVGDGNATASVEVKKCKPQEVEVEEEQEAKTEVEEINVEVKNDLEEEILKLEEAKSEVEVKNDHEEETLKLEEAKSEVEEVNVEVKNDLEEEILKLEL